MTADLETLRSSERRLQHELAQRRRRETSFMLRIAVKEREACEAQEALKRAAVKPQHRQVETLMLDPAMAGEIRRLREEVCHPSSPHLLDCPGEKVRTLARLFWISVEGVAKARGRAA